MKKAIKIVALALALVTLLAAFTSCGKTLSGAYSADILGTGTKLTFDGKDVKIAITVTLLGEVASIDATYKIKGDEITFDIANEDEITNDLAKKVVAELEKPSAFEEGDDYIKIGDVKYTKKAD